MEKAAVRSSSMSVVRGQHFGVLPVTNYETDYRRLTALLQVMRRLELLRQRAAV
jgi:hypothetical protein